MKNSNVASTDLQFESRFPSLTGFWDLFATTGWNDEYQMSPSALHSAITNSWHVVSVFHGGRLVGFGRIVSDGLLHAMIYDLIVDPQFQNLGIGSELLDRLIEHCQSAHIRDIQLFAAKGKRAFYERRGFRARSEEAPGMDFVSKRPAII